MHFSWGIYRHYDPAPNFYSKLTCSHRAGFGVLLCGMVGVGLSSARAVEFVAFGPSEDLAGEDADCSGKCLARKLGCLGYELHWLGRRCW